MELVFAILGWILFGLIVGALARLLYPGRQNISLVTTVLLGIAGSFVGGFVTWALTGGPEGPLRPASWLMSILGAILVVWIYLAFARRRIA
jgi:uncharacterized membrane protein YeaQ/YmgE (transglycosylase-associated protein family)